MSTLFLQSIPGLNANLSPQQMAACEQLVQALSTSERRVIEVVARAGTGKTTLLLELAKITQYFGWSASIYAFGRDIALEIQDRVGKLQLHGVKGSTFHSTGLQACNLHLRAKTGRAVKVQPSKLNDILSGMPAVWTVGRQLSGVGGSKAVRKILKLWASSQRAMSPVTLEALFREVVNQSAHPDPYGYWQSPARLRHLKAIEGLAQDLMAKVYEQSVLGVMDYDDQLFEAATRVRIPSDLQSHVVMVDEAQDLSRVRMVLASRLVQQDPQEPRVIVHVGDPAQAIMGFTGAPMGAMRLFNESLEAQGYRVVSLPLSVTYRVPKTGMRLAQTHVPEFSAYEKNIEGVVEKVGYGDVDWTALGPGTAVLCRQTGPLVKMWLEHGMGVETGESGHSWGIALDLNPLAEQLIDRFPNKDMVVMEALEAVEWDLEKEEARGEQQEGESLEEAEARVNYVRLEQLGELRTILIAFCSAYPEWSMEQVVGKLRQPYRGADVVLMTGHKAKGKEWKTVYLLGANLLMPSRKAKTRDDMEQERNLMYVCWTRHKERFVDVECEPEQLGLKPRKEKVEGSPC